MQTLLRRALAALLLAVTLHSVSAQTGTNSVLIVYDGGGSFGWYGNLHAKMLANLMGHFNLTPVLQPVESYTAGQISQHRAVFYMGMAFDNPLPAVFTNDVTTTTNPVCWVKNNLWQVSGNIYFPRPIDSRIGFRVVTLDGLNPDFSINTNLDTTIVYKNETFTKNKLDPVLGLIELVDTNIVVVPAVAWRTNNATTNTYAVPYIVHGSNFWYVSDSPFDYMSEEDRYLVFADLLHDILRINHPESHTAIIRLEDIAPEVYAAGQLTAATDYFKSNNVPFAMAVIPHYKDPLGYYNSGIPLEHRISDTNDVVARTMLGEFHHAGTNGGQFIMHGYTHQYDVVANPSTGVSADDFEFWRELFVTNSIELEHYEPVVEDSAAWVSNRLFLGLKEMTDAGISPLAWEPPHYAASELDYRIFSTNFNLTMMRALYFSDDYTPANRHIAGQFFPYPIERDIHGNRIIGENLGNYEPDPLPPSVGRTSAQIVSAAKKNLVIRDGTANAFFHGFYEHTNLYTIIQGVKALGYTYIPLVPTGAPVITFQPVSQTNQPAGGSFFVSVAAIGGAPLNYQWRLNGGDVSGATNAVLLFNPALTNQSGDYTCVISNVSGSITSTVALVDIGLVPTVTTQPVAQTNILGQPVNFSVVAGGTGPFTYQWRINATNVVANGTNATLAIAATQLTNAGNYSVAIANRYGAVTSSNAFLTLRLPPVITNQPASQLIVVSNAVTFTVGHLGDLPLKYQWYFNTNTAIVNATNISFALTSVKIANGGTFSVVLSNFYGMVTSTPALLTVVTTPIITNQPVSQSVFFGSNATFTAAVLGSPLLNFQWRLNNNNLAGANTNTLTVTNVQPVNLGDYTLVVGNNFGSVTSSIAALTANASVAITNQPVSQQVGGGSNATFTVGVSGTAPFAYQWRFNGTNLTAANTNSLTLTNVAATNTGNYDVIVTNAFGSVTSVVATLTVGFPPVITNQPAPLTLLQGATANFNVGVTGDAPFAYRWRVNGTNVFAATNSTLTLSHLVTADAGNYDVVVSSPYGAVTSAPAALVVVLPPVVTTPPQSRTNLAGTDAAFSVVVSGTSPFTYQWRFNGTNLTAANTNSLTVSNVQSAAIGNYDVVVSNAYAGVTSVVATLTVNFPPSITNQPAALVIGIHTNAIFTVGVSGTAPFAYQWRFNGTNISGAIANPFTLTNALATNAGNYDVVVTNAYGSVTSAPAALTVNFPPTITNQPVAQSVVVSNPATFIVLSSGSEPRNYQWWLNITNLVTGGTNSTLTIPSAQAADAGNYTVIIANPYGAVTSAPAALTVHFPASITNQPAPLAVNVTSNATFSVGATGDLPLAYQWRLNSTNISGANNNSLTISNAQATNVGNYSVVVSNSYGGVTSSVVALAVNFPPSITNQPVSLIIGGNAAASFNVGVSGSEPLTYQWWLNASNAVASATNATFNLASVQTNDAGSYTVVASNPFGSVTSSVATLTVYFVPTITNQPATQNVGVSNNVTFNVGVIGAATLAYQWSFNGAPLASANAAALTLTSVRFTNSGNYAVVITNNYGSVTSVVATLTVNSAPVITNQPTGRSVSVGGNTTFTVGVNGNAPLAFQWRRGGTNLLTGTNAALALTNVQTTNAGSYSVVVSNPYGSVTSSVATLSVTAPPVVTAQPQSRTNATGSAATFTVAATGSPAPNYQWKFNSVDIGGATNATLTLASVTVSNVGIYSVAVANVLGAVTSSNATLTVSGASAPVLGLVSAGANTVTLNFASQSGANYAVEYKDSLPSASWIVLTNVAGSGGVLNLNFSMPVNARFFRVRTP